MAYDVAIVVGLQMIVFCMFYLAMKMKEHNAPLRILFVTVGLYITLTNVDIMAKLSNINGQSAIESILYSNYGIFLYTIIFYLFYLIGLFLFETIKKFR